MSILAVLPRIASASVVFFGRYGAVTRQALQRGLSRQALYRQAAAVVAAVRGDQARAACAALRQQVEHLRVRLAAGEQRQRWTVRIDPDKQAEFAATAQAAGVSLSVAWGLLRLWLGPQTPSRAELGRQTRAAGRQAARLLTVLDAYRRPRARQVAADELFSGRQLVLMTVEPASLC